MYVTVVNIKNHMCFFIQIYFGTVFLHQCMCVYVCVNSIYYKFIIKESLKLTKGIT